MTVTTESERLHGDQHHVVVATDAKVSSREWSSETEHKTESLSPGKIFTLFSGMVPEALELGMIYRKHFQGRDFDDDIVENLRAPLAVRKKRIIESIVRRRLGMTHQEFLDNSSKIDAGFRARIFDDIDNTNIDVDLIIIGFRHHGNGRPNTAGLFRMILNDVQIERHFVCIGDGMSAAEQSLHRREQSESTGLTTTLYNVYEAKKLGENAPTVGGKTFLTVITPTSDEKLRFGVKVVNSKGLRALNKYYKEFGLRPVSGVELADDLFIKY
jgi:hypothetical protein